MCYLINVGFPIPLFQGCPYFWSDFAGALLLQPSQSVLPAGGNFSFITTDPGKPLIELGFMCVQGFNFLIDYFGNVYGYVWLEYVRLLEMVLIVKKNRVFL